MKYILTLLLFVNAVCSAQSDSEIHISEGKDIEAALSVNTDSSSFEFSIRDENNAVLVIDDNGCMSIPDSFAAIKALLKINMEQSKRIDEFQEKIAELKSIYFQQAAYRQQQDTIPPSNVIENLQGPIIDTTKDIVIRTDDLILHINTRIDTTKVLLLVSDTTHKIIRLYGDHGGESVDYVCENKVTSFVGYMVTKNWNTPYYLYADKRPLEKNIIVWSSKEIK